MIAEVIPRSLRYCGLEEGVMIWLIDATVPTETWVEHPRRDGVQTQWLERFPSRVSVFIPLSV